MSGFTSKEQLPIMLNVNHVALILDVSTKHAYNLLHSKGFPTIILGKRMMVDKDVFFTWLESRTQ
jgi:hypothetical protein